MENSEQGILVECFGNTHGDTSPNQSDTQHDSHNQPQPSLDLSTSNPETNEKRKKKDVTPTISLFGGGNGNIDHNQGVTTHNSYDQPQLSVEFSASNSVTNKKRDEKDATPTISLFGSANRNISHKDSVTNTTTNETPKEKDVTPATSQFGSVSDNTNYNQSDTNRNSHQETQVRFGVGPSNTVPNEDRNETGASTSVSLFGNRNTQLNSNNQPQFTFGIPPSNSMTNENRKETGAISSTSSLFGGASRQLQSSFGFSASNSRSENVQEKGLTFGTSHGNSNFHYPVQQSCFSRVPSTGFHTFPQRPSFCPQSSFNTISSGTNSHRVTKDTIAQDFYWRDYIPGEIPYDAIEDVDGKYVGQVLYDHCLLPASIDPQSNTAVVERAGKRIIYDNIKILCSPDPSNFYWESVNFEKMSKRHVRNAVKGGSQDGYNLYIGKVYYRDQWMITKVVAENIHNKGLQICDEFGKSVVLKKFHILKYKSNDDCLQDFYWRDYTGNIPHDAFQGSEAKYIGQVPYDNCNLPASIYPYATVSGNAAPTAVTERNGRRIINENIKILCSPDPSRFYWESVNFNGFAIDYSNNAVKGGNQDGLVLYIGKALHEGEWKIGKVLPKENFFQNGLHIWDQRGFSVTTPIFQILKYK